MTIYKVTERFVLHVGYSCNERCDFCYYLQELKNHTTKDWSTEENKKRITLAYKWGKREIDFSGGEPTIRKDLPQLITFAKDIGFSTINVITNGIICSKLDYCRTLQEAGLTEGLFSIHSHSPKIHDSLTHVRGSHDKVMRSLDNFHKLGLKYRVNTVITSYNYSYLNSFFEQLTPYHPATINLIVFNPSETATQVSSESSIRISDYRVIGDAISNALDIWKKHFKIINVRFLPFCFLPNHLDCIRTQWQKFHEDQEWDPILNVGLQKGWFAAIASILAGSFLPTFTPSYSCINIQTRLCKLLSNFRMRLYYRQNSVCKKCAAGPICTGVQRDYVAKYGYPEFVPLQGEKIQDPLHFCKRYPEIFKSLRDE